MTTDTIDLTRVPRIGSGKYVVVSPDAEVYVDVPCEVCEGLIPFARYVSALTRPNAKARYCNDTCMNTAHVRAHRASKR